MSIPLRCPPFPGVFIAPRPDDRGGEEFRLLEEDGVCFMTVVYLGNDHNFGLNVDEQACAIRDWIREDLRDLDLRPAEGNTAERTQVDTKLRFLDDKRNLGISVRNPSRRLEQEALAFREARRVENINKLRSRYGKPTEVVESTAFDDLPVDAPRPTPQLLRFLLEHSEGVVVWHVHVEYGLYCWFAERNPRRSRELPFECARLNVDCLVRPPNGALPVK